MPYSYPPSDIPKIKPEIKKRWVEALRSGEYNQATGSLRSTDPTTLIEGYCCLGVLCDVVKDDPEIRSNPDMRWSSNGCFGTQNVEPPFVIDKYVAAGVYRDWTALIERNDGDGGPQRTFAQIADLIERHG